MSEKETPVDASLLDDCARQWLAAYDNEGDRMIAILKRALREDGKVRIPHQMRGSAPKMTREG